jgi:hypothetical protein
VAFRGERARAALSTRREDFFKWLPLDLGIALDEVGEERA